MNVTETKTSLLVKSPTSPVVHVGHRSHLRGHVVTDCNGRTMTGWVLEADAVVTCKRCAKAVK